MGIKMFRILFPHNLSYSTNLCLKSLPNTVVRIYQSKLYTKIQPNSPVNPPTLCDVNFGDIKEREALPPFLLFCKALPSYFIVIMPCRAVQPPPHFFGIFEGVARVSVWWAPGGGGIQLHNKGREIPNICYPKQNGYTAISAEFPHGRLYTHLSAFVWIIIFAFLMRTAFSFCLGLCVFRQGLLQIFIRNGGQM